MILGTIHNATLFYPFQEGLKAFFEYIAQHHEMPIARPVTIDGDITIVKTATMGTSVNRQPLAQHRRYIHIYVSLTDGAYIGWKPQEQVSHNIDPYNPEYDTTLSSDFPEAIIPLAAGRFAIAYPWDACSTNIGSSEIVMIIGKIPYSPHT